MSVDLETLVDRATEWFNVGRFPYEGQPEALTRQYLINPLLSWLGWSDVPTDEFHFVSEFSGGMERKWEDYVLMRKNRPLIFVECKELFAQKILTKYNINELLDYMKEYNRKNPFGHRVDWGVLTNFREIHFFYVSDKKPFYSSKLEDILDEKETIRETLSIEGVKGEGLEHLYSESRKEMLGDLFLEDLKKWRLIIANGFYKENPSLNIPQLKEISQQVLDRFIFVRMLETLRILPYNWLRNTYLKWNEGIVGLNKSFSEVVREQFSTIESLYDTELFLPRLCDQLEISDRYLKELVKAEGPLDAEVANQIGVSGQQRLDDRGLYGYNFKTLTIDIIGSAYERYLAHEIEIVKNRVTIKETDKLRKKEGVYYTPPYVVDYIIQQTVEPSARKILQEAQELIREGLFKKAYEKIHEISQIKVLDPACGSGSFLIKAFDAIAKAYVDYNKSIQEKLQDVLKKKGLIGYLEAGAEELQIIGIGERVLLDNIYGVDLDPQAVEISKLNLWLKMLGVSPEIYRPIVGKTQRKLLPSLETRIKCGNSLCSGITLKDLEDGKKAELFRTLASLRKKVEDSILKTTPAYTKEESPRTELSSIRENIEKLREKTREMNEEANRRLIEEGFFKEEEKEFEGLSGTPFNWELEFPEVFLSRGFDIIIGNPPHGGELTCEERGFIEKEYALGSGYKNTAFLFLELCQKKLKRRGKLGMVIPKSLTFSEKWKKVRQFLFEELPITEIEDISKAFKGVLLEQVVLLAKKEEKTTDHILGGRLESGKAVIKKNRIPLSVCEQVDALSIHADEKALEILRKISTETISLASLTHTFRGFPYQSKLTSECSSPPCEVVLRGDHIRRFSHATPEEFLEERLIKGKDKTEEMRRLKIIAQRIVAHIENPVDHIAIMATLDREGLLSVDTVENILVTEEKYDPRYILALLNSRFIAWYAYNFIFCNAIRTMDLDEYYVGKIPVIPTNLDLEEVEIKQICQLVSEMLAISKQKNWMFQAFQKLRRHYNLEKEEPLKHYLHPRNASIYHINLTNTHRIEQKIQGIIQGYNVELQEGKIVLEVTHQDSKSSVKALQIDFDDEEVRDYFYLSLKRWEGRKNYRTYHSILERTMEDFTVPRLSTKSGEESNIDTFRDLLNHMKRAFGKESETEWKDSPIQEMNPVDVMATIETKDRQINKGIYRLYNLTSDEIRYIEEKTPSLTRLT